jgi:ADP-heptose:LPS heptosyltransferase
LDLRFQRFVDRYVGVPACALLSLVERLRPTRRRRAASPEARTIVVILLSEMGSLVLAHPMFDRLRRRVPRGAVHVVLFGKNREALDLLRVVPEANVIEVDEGSVGGLARTLWGTLRTLWRLRPDVIIDCELFARVSSILSYLSGAPVRVGFHPGTQEGLYRGSFINRRVPYNPYQHISRQFLMLADAADSHATPVTKDAVVSGDLAAPYFRFDAGEVERMRAKLLADFPALAGRSLVLVYPGAGILPIRAWPIESFVALCETLRDDGHAVGLIGLAADHALAESIAVRLASARCVNLAGYTKSIRHLLALFRAADLLVTNDGGPGHFAALTPLPTIVFFGPETPALYGSHTPNAHFMYRPLPCSPCLTAYNHRNSPCDGDNQCLKQIPPGEVIARARALLASREDALDTAPESVAGA